MILDATRGSIARFINHSCEPNCKMIKWTVAGKPRMALFAGEKGIMTGDELTYDYNFNPYSIKNVQECRCGALSCRGVLGPKPKEIKDALKPLTVGGKRKFQQALEDTLQKITKKRKLPGASSVTKALAVTKTRTGRKIARARILNSSTVRNKHIVKKAPTRLVKANRIERKILHTMHRVKRDSMITYSRRRSSAETFVKGSASTDEGPPSKRGNIKSKAASMRNGVVRTLRSSNRSGASGSGGKTIRVIDDGT